MKPGTNSWRVEHYPSCGAADLVRLDVGDGFTIAVARGTEEAYHALFDCFRRYGYEVRRKVTGTFNCRKITGGDTLSSHAFGIAIDVNWDTNPYVRGKLVTDMPRPMVEEIQEIRTRDGVRVWRWGGDWDGDPTTGHRFYDAMHFELIATLEELAAGIDRDISDAHIRRWPILRRGAKGPAVAELQRMLGGLTADGDFGPATERAVRDFQASRGLTVDAVVGPATWTALTYELPALDPGEIGPGKNVAA